MSSRQTVRNLVRLVAVLAVLAVVATGLAACETVGSDFYIALSPEGPGPRLSRVELVRLAALEVQGTEEIAFDASSGSEG